MYDVRALCLWLRQGWHRPCEDRGAVAQTCSSEWLVRAGLDPACFLRVERSATSIPAPELASMEHQWAIDKAVLLAGRVFHKKMWEYQSDLVGKTGDVNPPVQTNSRGRYHDPMQPLCEALV